MKQDGQLQYFHPLTKQQAKQEKEKRYAMVVETPFGDMTLVQRGEYLSELRLNGEVNAEDQMMETPLLLAAAQELAEFFAGGRRQFALPLAPEGTPFQLLAWEALYSCVPYGETISYGELAKRCDRPKAARAIGMANHHNPLPIFIPCHRVIGSNGKLVGYGGGLPLKQALLALEQGKNV